jgi:phthalate 4,5-cis-dihydrodiol dehydrogenase
MATTPTTIRMGMVGIGVGGAEVLPAMEHTPGIELFAGADINPVTRQRFQEKYPESRVYDGIEALCADPDVDAVWVSTPNRFHAPHAIYALEHGKNVIVEKPMALNLREAGAMNEAAARTGQILMAGHTQSYTFPIRAMRRIINSGKIGKLVNLHAMAFTDWILRPRSGEELDPEQGGGISWRQTPHQVDSIRLVGGGRVRSVRGTTGRGVSWRPVSSFYSAYLEFEDGTPAYVVHDGHGYFYTSELWFGGEGNSRYTTAERAALRGAMSAGLRNEEADKQALRIGGETPQWERMERQGESQRPWSPADLGIFIVSAERGAIRHSPFGVYVYDDAGQHDVDLRINNPPGGAPRRGELNEFYRTVVEGQPMFHDGRWGMATLEVSLAIMESARERKEILLSHQVVVPESYDADLKVPYLDE